MRKLASSDLIYDIRIHFAGDFMVLIAHSKSSIHPFSSGCPYQDAGRLEPIPAIVGRDTVYTLDRSPIWRMANTEWQTF